ncbi:crotonase/enoyl-CoA hydratase family protein [Gammaproteobacteria bacterium]|nr:crotonase/enoyl-CoA hydratase family protein [Gammaproteobacteria bacterium]
MKYALNDKIATITLDDGKANAVSHTLIDTLNTALDQAETEATAVVLLGRTGIFSAGFDLKEIQKGPDAAAALVGRGAEMFYRLFNYPLPLIAGCTGHAMAAGAFILLSCDTRVGVRGDFKLGLNETAIGMSLPVFGLELARNRLSKRHLTAAVVQSRLYDPASAVDSGYLDETVDVDELEARCHDLATELSALPTAAYARMKRDLRQATLETIKASLGE